MAKIEKNMNLKQSSFCCFTSSRGTSCSNMSGMPLPARKELSEVICALSFRPKAQFDKFVTNKCLCNRLTDRTGCKTFHVFASFYLVLTHLDHPGRLLGLQELLLRPWQKAGASHIAMLLSRSSPSPSPRTELVQRSLGSVGSDRHGP